MGSPHEGQGVLNCSAASEPEAYRSIVESGEETIAVVSSVGSFSWLNHGRTHRLRANLKLPAVHRRYRAVTLPRPGPGNRGPVCWQILAESGEP